MLTGARGGQHKFRSPYIKLLTDFTGGD